MTRKFCPKCYNEKSLGEPKFCDKCGTPMVDWTLKCECGEEIRPIFYEVLPFWRIPMYHHCNKCGKRTDKLLKLEAKGLNLLMIQKQEKKQEERPRICRVCPQYKTAKRREDGKPECWGCWKE